MIGSPTCKIIAACLLLAGFAAPWEPSAQSTFYMTTDVTQDNQDDIKLFDVEVTSPESLDFTIVTISLPETTHAALRDAAFERRNPDQKLLLQVPVNFSKDDGAYAAELHLANETLPGAELWLYIGKEGAQDVLAKYYGGNPPENCAGVSYRIRLDSLK